MRPFNGSGFNQSRRPAVENTDTINQRNNVRRCSAWCTPGVGGCRVLGEKNQNKPNPKQINKWEQKRRNERGVTTEIVTRCKTEGRKRRRGRSERSPGTRGAEQSRISPGFQYANAHIKAIRPLRKAGIMHSISSTWARDSRIECRRRQFLMSLAETRASLSARRLNQR